MGYSTKEDLRELDKKLRDGYYEEFKDMRIIASIMGMGTDPDSWAKLALEAQQAGAEAIEMNMGSVMMMETASEALKGIMEKRKLPSGAIIGLVPEVVADLIRAIKQIRREGVTILVCGTCLNHFKLLDKRKVGETTNMLDIVTAMQLADSVINI
jgi:predicted peroxiredoxin